MIQRDCAICGDVFMPVTGFQKYCGVKCRKEGERVSRICSHCGEEFRRPRSSLVRYCSSKCANTATAAARKGKLGRFGSGNPVKSMPQVCPWCQGKFTPPAGKRQKYCSTGCSNSGRAAKRRHTLGTPLQWSVSSKGEDVCRVCGYPAAHLHHIVPRSKSKRGHSEVARNGMPLCAFCHRGWHDGRVVIFREHMLPEEVAFAAEIAGPLWLDLKYPSMDECLSREQQARMVREKGMRQVHEELTGATVHELTGRRSLDHEWGLPDEAA